MTAALQIAPETQRRAVLSRRIRPFAGATITYNVIEAVVALWAGNVADSSALIGFGLDSVIEVASAVALSWQFSAKDPERREHVTLRIIAFSFFALALFVTVDSVRSLTGGGEAQHSTPGIVIATLSLAIMPVLSWLQRRAGRELGSKTAVADSKQTLLCTYLSAVLLVGLVLNSTLGWWWADAGAALVIAAIAVREGVNAWKGDVCCTVPHAVAGDDETASDDCCPPSRTGAREEHGEARAFSTTGVPAAGSTDAACCEGCGSGHAPEPVRAADPPGRLSVSYELRTIPGCPNSGPALALFRSALQTEGIDPGLVRVREITSDAQAAALQFHGSPSFTAAGQDMFSAASTAALSCRLYPSDQGGLSGLPSIESLRAAVGASGGTA